MDVFAAVPVVLVGFAQDVARRGIRRYSPLSVEVAWVSHSPEQFTVVQPADPMASHSGVFAGGLAQ